ncbi:MAG: ATP-dependent metallopeptidase FtsH/Yme1/Tma family protein [Cytophagales bacterium]|nr:MAG: ATP-dependent metallopeptidase FtsH/Yme1/Tma family protein [Cytophagales bacterium]TAH28160.1 MAG: ATP-dependent metallopeptidase FtsH/Yme1/Tma family protein [Cytophagales bacterium]
MGEQSNNNPQNNTPNKPRNNNNNSGGSYQFWLIVGMVLLVVGLVYFSRVNTPRETTRKKFTEMLVNQDVKEVVVLNRNMVEITLKREALKKKEYQDPTKTRVSDEGPHYKFRINSVDKLEELIATAQKDIPKEKQIETQIEDRGDLVNNLMYWGSFILILFFIWILIRRMAGPSGPGGQIFNIGRSKAALFDADNKIKITFNDVAGLDEAKEEIQEIVEFLRNPGKFTNLGGKIPKGALLVGPPGTGKTLLAKAVAGEAAVPFFSLSGSDFVEMFVGVGAARVRDLFKQAKEKAPCIIFIDEVDAIGRARGRGAMPGANDERENTLNSLLVEMDGFATDSGVIILAATNRPDILDSALMRPGRFDRQISIDRPDIIGREAIFKVHLQPLRLSGDVDAKKLAAQTPGFAGAEIANVCNEAALIAARRNKSSVEMVDFQDAVDRVIGGLEKKNKIISPEEKEIIAYHEAGHAVTSWFLEHANPLVKVSIVPRGVAALGYAQYLPKEQYIYRTEQLIDDMCTAFGGRAAEEIVFAKISTGALSDLERITKMAYGMVTIYGMNDRIGNISFYDPEKSEFSMGKPYSDVTARIIDEEVKKIIDSAYLRTCDLLKEKREELDKLAKALLEKEIIFQDDLERILGKRPFAQLTSYQSFMEGKKAAPIVSEEIETPKTEVQIDLSKTNS